MGELLKDNEQRAEETLYKCQFDFSDETRIYILNLLEQEIKDDQQGSSEYVRVLFNDS